MKQLALALLAGCLCGTPAGDLRAEGRGAGGERASVVGRPRVTLDGIDLSRAPLAAEHEKELRLLLARQAGRLDWGAGRDARIVYRFRIDELTAVEDGDVLRLSCSATGWLPKGKRATSRLSFGGAPKDRSGLVKHVLEIVARGVLTRLAEMERQRREEGNQSN